MVHLRHDLPGFLPALPAMQAIGYLDQYQALPSFGHPAARPAAGGLAEHLRKLPLGYRLTVLDAGTVGSYRGGVGVALTATGTNHKRPAGKLVRLVRGPVRVVRYVQARPGSRVCERRGNLGSRGVPNDGPEPDYLPAPVRRSGIGRRARRAPRVRASMVRRLAVVVGCWYGPDRRLLRSG
jgi:hypothetical protein